jgi:regulator of sigma E protease
VFENLTIFSWFIVAICILVAFHEFGHFYVARLCGVKVLRFSIGFGYRLIKWTDKSGTEFAISAIPLGGYVKMQGEADGDIAEEDKAQSYNSKTVWQRISIAAAGPGANFILALVLYWFSFYMVGTSSLSPILGNIEPGSVAAQAHLERGQEIIAIDGEATPTRRAVAMHLLHRLGESGDIHFVSKYPNSDLEYETNATLDNWLRGAHAPDPIAGLGLSFFEPLYETAIVNVYEGTPAAQAGLMTGDELLELDGIAVVSGNQWMEYVKARPEVAIEMVVGRKGERLSFSVIPEKVVNDAGETIGRAGVAIPAGSFPKEMIRRHEYGPLAALSESAKESWDTGVFVLVSMKKLILGEISTKNLSGPIGIAKVAADHARHGFWAFVALLAHLSILLGVLNLMPIPILDGGQIVYCLVERFKGSPVSENAQVVGFQVGLIMMLGVMMIAFYNDIFL